MTTERETAMPEPADIVELRKLLAKATPGPWYHYDEVFRPRFGREPELQFSPRRRITEIQRDKDGQSLIRWSGFDGLDGQAHRKRNANAALIVAAVNALPALLDEIERLRASLTNKETTDE